MSQNNVIAAVLLLAFLIFITVRGELPKYAAVFFGSSAGTQAPAQPEKQADAGSPSDPVARVAGGLSRLQQITERFA